MVDQPRHETEVTAKRTVEFMGAEVPLSELPMFCKIDGVMGLMFLFYSEGLVLVPNQSVTATGDDGISVVHSSRLILLQNECGTFNRNVEDEIHVVDEAKFERRLQSLRDLAEDASSNPRVLLIHCNSAYDDYRGPYCRVKKSRMSPRPFIHPSLSNNPFEKWMCRMAVGKTELMTIQFESLGFFEWKIQSNWERTLDGLRANGLSFGYPTAKPRRYQASTFELRNFRSARGNAATGPRRRNRDNQLASRRPPSHRAFNRLRQRFNAEMKARQETSCAARTFKAVLNVTIAAS